MDLIYTDANRIDQGVLSAYSLDLSFGEDDKENDFEIVLGKNEPALEYDAVIYFEGTEYGGIVDFAKVATDAETITYGGRTWHGLINSKIIAPDSGQDYLIVSGNANRVLATLINRLGLSALFTVSDEESAITISSYQFERYCKGYVGIRKMLAANGAKLRIRWEDRKLQLSVVPVMNYTDAPIDGDIALLDIEQHNNKVNHLICLGSGELAEREVIHLYVDQFGRIGDTQYYTGLDEITEIYDFGNTESSEELRTNGIENLTELQRMDVFEMSIPEDTELAFDIGDIVGTVDAEKTGLAVTATIVQKIIKVENGILKVEYQTGTPTKQNTSNSAGGASSASGSGKDGVTFIPSVSADGDLSWTNNGGLVNPEPVNIKGEPGEDGYTPRKNIDYFDGKDGSDGSPGVGIKSITIMEV